ncbi:23680_t:CDS:2 [Dentiscutata erythropus]|uniref:23680_t:CDS:1 n=1 Tax=Dentiscutata erythropus TaxID=1348616 RepID=A0A9N8V8B1_9GLOM|nr:23680_t:CDS:2 [Dentiscutata erythropus]
MKMLTRFSCLVLHSLKPRAFFQYSQKRAKQVKLACKLPTHASSFNYHHLDSLKVSIKPALAEDFVIPKDAEDTDLEQYIAPHINFKCISDSGVRTFITKLHEVVRNSSKKFYKGETLTESLLDDLLYIDNHLDIFKPGNEYGEPQLAIEILSSGDENSCPYYDKKLGYYKDQTVFVIRVISTHVTFYKAMIPARYWNELENGYPEKQSIEILKWPAINLEDSSFDLAVPNGRKKVLSSLINIHLSLLQSIRNN